MRNQEGNNGVREKPDVAKSKGKKNNYKGFVAGVFSGIAKLSGEFLPLACHYRCVSCEKSINFAGI